MQRTRKNLVSRGVHTEQLSEGRGLELEIGEEESELRDSKCSFLKTPRSEL